MMTHEPACKQGEMCQCTIDCEPLTHTQMSPPILYPGLQPTKPHFSHARKRYTQSTNIWGPLSTPKDSLGAVHVHCLFPISMDPMTHSNCIIAIFNLPSVL